MKEITDGFSIPLTCPKCEGKMVAVKYGDSITMAFPDLIPEIIPEERKPLEPPMVNEEYEDNFEDEYDEEFSSRMILCQV